jgi:hypothetical protein
MNLSIQRVETVALKWYDARSLHVNRPCQPPRAPPLAAVSTLVPLPILIHVSLFQFLNTSFQSSRLQFGSNFAQRFAIHPIWLESACCKLKPLSFLGFIGFSVCSLVLGESGLQSPSSWWLTTVRFLDSYLCLFLFFRYAWVTDTTKWKKDWSILLISFYWVRGILYDRDCTFSGKPLPLNLTL